MWAVNIAPFHEKRAANTGLFDESVTIDRCPWLDHWLRTLKGSGAPRRPLWPFSLGQLARKFQEAMLACGLSHLKPVLYSIRHGGASEDLLRGTRDLAAVFRRGRWRSWSSVRRYGKEAKLLSELAKVPPATLAYGQYIEQNLEAMFADPDRVPPVPQV